MYRGSVGAGIVWLIGTVVCYLLFGAFGVIVHLICVFSAAASVSAPIVALPSPREERTQPTPPPPRVPPTPAPRWMKVAFGAFAAVIVVAVVIVSLLPPSGSTGQVKEARYLTPLDVFTEPHAEGQSS
jgi:hypothetical protein